MSRMMSVDYSQFFDRKHVIDVVDAADRKVLSRAGAFVRRTAKSSIRRPGKRKKTATSKPGKPPKSQTRVLPQSIFFGYDRDTASVVVGPSTRYGRGDNKIPSILEHGGRAEGGGVILKRPYMLPALEKNAPKFPQLWRGQAAGP